MAVLTTWVIGSALEGASATPAMAEGRQVLADVNLAIDCDREAAYGFRLDIRSETSRASSRAPRAASSRFEPGASRRVEPGAWRAVEAIALQGGPSPSSAARSRDQAVRSRVP